jgi:cytidyltransferase-like protein
MLKSRTGVLKKLNFLILISSALLVGCQTLETQHFPPSHRAVIGRYSDQMPAIPPGKTVVLVGGVFDIVHYGHLGFFKAAKSHGDYLVIAIEPDAFIEKCKHRVPVHTQAQRAELLSHMDMVDAVIMLPMMGGYKDYLDLVERIHPSVIAVTEGDPYRAEKEKQATTVGAQVVGVVNRSSELSTTQIFKHMYYKLYN